MMCPNVSEKPKKAHKSVMLRMKLEAIVSIIVIKINTQGKCCILGLRTFRNVSI